MGLDQRLDQELDKGLDQELDQELDWELEQELGTRLGTKDYGLETRTKILQADHLMVPIGHFIYKHLDNGQTQIQSLP